MAQMGILSKAPGMLFASEIGVQTLESLPPPLCTPTRGCPQEPEARNFAEQAPRTNKKPKAEDEWYCETVLNCQDRRHEKHHTLRTCNLRLARK